MDINKSFLASLTIAFLGDIAYVNQALAQVPLLHDTSAVPVNQSLVPPTYIFNPNALGMNVNLNTNSISTESGDIITLSPKVINNLIQTRSTNNSVSPGENTISEESITNTSDDNNSLKMTVCLRRRACFPKTEGDIAVTLNELLELIEADLNQSLGDLALAEANEQKLANQPRRITRRRDSNCANCAAASRNTVSELRGLVETKLEQSKNFIEQIKKISPENSTW